MTRVSDFNDYKADLALKASVGEGEHELKLMD
jgi:hypothetical protein